MKVILASPNFHQARGNTVTVQRISDGLNKLGIETKIINITNDYEFTYLPKADIVHGFNAYRFGQFIKRLAKRPERYVVTMTGTDLNIDLYDPEKKPLFRKPSSMPKLYTYLMMKPSWYSQKNFPKQEIKSALSIRAL
ncbi:hypothetical protein M5V91_08800 [Cytobacillus pseudoceanisediminis]|uniref:hypothetical protein n=1 Tax=Cytobacillus pseudoceanisediminis TaxID=3051614 RepID=UPI002184D8E9|nr:hypothetical protein [Cytobacillus pseudoceanisediminis]UQX55731.1 hypothetical protein M5V91_08800 [Cytobacillus pseudoceanisediminis]